MSDFDPNEHARRELSPVLRQLIELTEEAAPEQHAFFSMILWQIDGASEPAQLAEAFVHLSTAAFLGFEYSPPVDDLLDLVLERAQVLSETLSIEPQERQ